MTCIVGLELGGGRVMFGADSMASECDSYTVNYQPKIWKHGDLILAAAGVMYLCDHLHYVADIPSRVVGDPEKWLRAKLMPALDAAIKKANRAGDEEYHGVGLLVGLSGMVFCVTPQKGEATRSLAGYESIGNGSEVAIGSLYTTAQAEGLIPDPQDRIEMAIRAASSRCLGVGGPITILEGKANERKQPATRNHPATKATGRRKPKTKR